MTAGRIDAEWLGAPAVQRLLSVLSADGEGARVVGGAVRNTLMGHRVTDVDVATTCEPGETRRRLDAAGIKAVDTGIDHGTVTAVIDRKGYEITTLREDVETDGRRAVVRFGRDWRHDAARRDFTVNALYADADGTVHDFVGGRDDIERAVIRFIGDAETRIAEDYLRILRFFRFFAWYGKGRPDAEGLKACARLRRGIAGLSAERIWTEMRKLLAATDPSRALLWMRQAGVLTQVLPESEKWGIDGIHGLVEAERRLGWAPDAPLRLMVLIPPREDIASGLAARWKVANTVRDRLRAAARQADIASSASIADLRQQLYRGDPQAVVDRLRLAITRAGWDSGEGRALANLLAEALTWQRPVFPLAGRDLIDRGRAPGPALGATLARLEDAWAASDFALDRDALIAMAQASDEA